MTSWNVPCLYMGIVILLHTIWTGTFLKGLRPGQIFLHDAVLQTGKRDDFLKLPLVDESFDVNANLHEIRIIDLRQGLPSRNGGILSPKVRFGNRKSWNDGCEIEIASGQWALILFLFLTFIVS